MARVRFLGIVRDWMRCDRLEAPADTLGEVLQAMRVTGGWRFEDRAFRNGGGLIPEMEFLVNGHNARFLQGPDIALKPGDEVIVFIHCSWAEVPFM
ncbi:MAG TPA: MoaD/ThiS family protein [Candidatus Methylomirabilis sp.]|nr:MoaD/ThiS family protein [Candidatus Methylomirabilis sp.]